MKPNTILRYDKQIGIVQKKPDDYMDGCTISSGSSLVRVVYSEITGFNKNNKEDISQVWPNELCTIIKEADFKKHKKNLGELLK